MFQFLLRKNKYYGKKTFTFYIPAPPARKTGYQEKEFDNLIEHILGLGFELVDFKLQSHSGEERTGLWVLCILGAPTKEVFNQKVGIDYSMVSHNSATEDLSRIPLDPDIIHDN